MTTDYGLTGGIVARAKIDRELQEARDAREKRDAEIREEQLATMVKPNPSEHRAERERLFALEEQRKAEIAERQLKSRLRARYLEVPGTSESDFESAYPRLKAQHAERVALGHEGEIPASGFADPKMWGL